MCYECSLVLLAVMRIGTSSGGIFVDIFENMLILLSIFVIWRQFTTLEKRELTATLESSAAHVGDINKGGRK
jgi:hypothetical protein